MGVCPSSAELENFLSDGLPADNEGRVLSHLESCSACQDVLERLTSGLVGDNSRATPEAASHTPEVGKPDIPVTDLQIGPYKLIRKLGEGGMGTVFLAEQEQPVKRTVALKLVKEGMDSEPILARFKAERQVLALMNNPNIAHVLDVGATSTGRPYYVMDLVQGIPITKYCDQQQLSPKERLALFVPVCQAVQHAHHKGIIHRDLKPSNVLVGVYDGQPVPKVIDFGLAKAVGQKLTDHSTFTEVGQLVGTVEYMSPEQAEVNQLDIDTRSDIYSLGVMLYELLTGSTPFTGKELRKAPLPEMLRIIREVEPLKPSARLSSSDVLAVIASRRNLEPRRLEHLVKGELDWIVMKCLEKERGRRYQTANSLAEDVQHYLRDEPVSACPPSRWYRLRKFARRNKGALRSALAAVVVLLLISAGVVYAIWEREAVEARRSTETERAVYVALANAEQFREQAGTMPSTKAREAEAVLAVWDQARAAVGQAEAALLTGTASDRVHERVLDVRDQIELNRHRAEQHSALLHREETLLRDLDDARMAEAGLVDNHFDHAGAATKYAAAFATYGLPVAEGEVLARRIRAEEPAMREALIVALDIWARAASYGDTRDKELAARLRARADQADDDPWRHSFRDAVNKRDLAALMKLSSQCRKLSLPPANVVLLALSLKDVVEGGRKEALALLRWARGPYPADFWMTFELGMLLRQRSQEEQNLADLEEEIGCYRSALALRPNASAVYMYLGIALQANQQFDEAVAAHRKAVELNPNYDLVCKCFADMLATKGLPFLRDYYEENIKKDSASAPLFWRMGMSLGGGDPYAALACKGLMEEALGALKESVRLDAKNAEKQQVLAWLLDNFEDSRYRDPKTALVLQRMPLIWSHRMATTGTPWETPTTATASGKPRSRRSTRRWH